MFPRGMCAVPFGNECVALAPRLDIRNRIAGTHVSPAALFKLGECHDRVEQPDCQAEMRLEQLIIHVRENRNAAETEVERMYLLALLEDLARLKGERQRLEEEMELARAE